MKITINAQGAERKRLVQVISNYLETPAKYCGAPTFNYQIGQITITRNGSLEIEDTANIEHLLQHISEEGFDVIQFFTSADSAEAPEPETEDATDICISMPRELFSDTALDNLKALIAAKHDLICKAIGVADLPLEVSDEKVSFPWFTEIPDLNDLTPYEFFICKLCEMARNQKRITAKEKPIENEKYAFRCFLLRLGFIGEEYKQARKILLRNFSGSAAFKSGQRKEAE